MTGMELEGLDGERLTLADVEESWSEGLPYGLRPPMPTNLTQPADEDDARRVIALVTRYPAFEPPFPEGDRDAVLVELIASSEGDAIPFEVALAVELLGQPVVRGLLRRIVAEGRFATAWEPFQTFLSYLLDDPDSRPTVADELRRAKSDDRVRSMAKSLAVELDADAS
ncbi:MAG TPA: hypothetical protein VM143_12775 [Acidimicrobiales bacterium]|nr:hypothetical protein [Acidimicrobiales bacterium]